MKYREKFHISWEDFLNTPLRIINEDLEMIGIEADVRQYQEQNAQNTK
jgi:hypothetical protein